MRQPRHVHIDLIDELLVGISGAYAALCEFHHVVSDEAEAGACSGGKPARAARLPAVRDALEPHLQVAYEIGHFLSALAAVAKLRMHIEPERRLPAAHIAGLV